MRTIKQILTSDERVIFVGKVHPVLYFKGIAYLLVAWILWTKGAITLASVPLLARWAASALYYFPPAVHTKLALSIVLATVGVMRLLDALVLIMSTEFAVTTRRVIAKTGVTTTTMLEMDRHKLAGVMVVQSMMGRILGYGDVTLRGFSGNIIHLPPLCQPLKLQAELGRGL